MLVLERFSENAFADPDRKFAEIIAGQVAIAFLLQKSVRSIRAVQTISSDILLGKAVLADAYRNALNVILGLLEAERGQILIADSNGLRIVVSTRHIDVGIRADKERSVCGQYLLQ